jgi:glutaredoxin-related protein
MAVDDIVLYSTECPKCKVLEQKLDTYNIDYSLETDTNKMTELGFTKAPMLKVGDTILDFYHANQWINEEGARLNENRA